MARTGANALFEALVQAGVEVVFGYPGGAMLPGYDALIEADLRHVLVRHEQGAGHMAEGYAQASGRVGIVMATSGPGATNLVTPLADAYLDSVPVVAITGQVATPGLGREAFQEVDIVSITAPITKHAVAVDDPDKISTVVTEAMAIALSDRPGPVVVDIPKDVLAARTTFEAVRASPMPVPPAPDMEAIRQAARALLSAGQPLLYVGGGVLKADAARELRELVDMINAPVVTTLMGRGAFPDSHPAHLGMPGMHGLWTATTAMQRCDLLVALGARFDDRVTGDLATFAPDATVVHVDIDPVEIGKNRSADIPIVGDCRTVLRHLTAEVHWLLAAEGGYPARSTAQWWKQLRSWQQDHPPRWRQDSDGRLKPQTALRAIDARLDGSGIVLTGVGQHQMWAAQHLRRDRPRTWITSGGLGTMGFCLPAAIGAKLARPHETVVAIDGDGSFQMTLQELATAREAGAPVLVMVLNNGGLGMVRQWQRLFYDGRFSHVDWDGQLPCLVQLAQAYGCVGLRCGSQDELEDVLDEAFAVDAVPVVVDIHVDPDEEVFPMVAAGASNDEVVECADALRFAT